LRGRGSRVTPWARSGSRHGAPLGADRLGVAGPDSERCYTGPPANNKRAADPQRPAFVGRRHIL
jgi:hypothetical protein